MAKRKTKKAQAGTVGSHLEPLVDGRLVKALDHVLRQHILLAATESEISPSDLSRVLGVALSGVAHHVRVLHKDCEMLEEVGREPVRGTVEHFYRATSKTLLPAKDWGQLKKGLRAVIGAGQASDLFNDLAAALQAGKLKGSDDHISRMPLILDAEGRRKVNAIAMRAVAEVEDEQRATAARRSDESSGVDVRSCTFSVFAFETAGRSQDVASNGDKGSRKVKGPQSKQAKR